MDIKTLSIDLETRSSADIAKAGLYRYAKSGTPVYLIDPEDVAIYDPKITHIREVATKGMEIFISKL